MAWLDFLSRCFGRSFSTPRITVEDSAVALADPPEGETEQSAPGEAAWWAPEGERVLAPPPPGHPRTPTDSVLHGYVVRVLKSPDLELPRLPVVAQRALLLLRNESVNYRELANLVGQDPVLAAEVLRVANSVAYRGMREIGQLEPAFVRLGHRAIRSIVLATNLKAIAIRTGGAEKSLGEEIWQCCLASAVVMSALGKRFGLSEEDAFLIGLLHDIGKLAMLKLLYEYQRTHGQKVTRRLYDELCEEWHEHIGLRLADEWNLPAPLPDLIGRHHKLPAADDPLRNARLLIGLSDATCSLLRYAPYVPYDFFNLPYAKELGLRDEPATHRLLADLPELIADRMDAF